MGSTDFSQPPLSCLLSSSLWSCSACTCSVNSFPGMDWKCFIMKCNLVLLLKRSYFHVEGKKKSKKPLWQPVVTRKHLNLPLIKEFALAPVQAAPRGLISPQCSQVEKEVWALSWADWDSSCMHLYLLWMFPRYSISQEPINGWMWVESWHEFFNLMLNTLPHFILKHLWFRSPSQTLGSASCRTRKWDCCRCKDRRLCLTFLTLAVFYAPDLFPLPWTWIQTLSQQGRNVFHQRSDPVLIFHFSFLEPQEFDMVLGIKISFLSTKHCFFHVRGLE